MPDEDDDPNEAYDVIPKPKTQCGPEGWWTVTMNGIPVLHSPDRWRMEAYASSPEIRAARRAKHKAGRRMGGNE